MIRRSRDAHADAFVRDLVVPRGLVVRMEHDVRVPLHHPRHQRRPGHVDDRPTRGVDGCADGFDAIATNADGPPFVHRFAVEDARGLEDQHHGLTIRQLARGSSILEESQAGHGYAQSNLEGSDHGGGVHSHFGVMQLKRNRLVGARFTVSAA